jgi:hypothetical protein
MPGVLEPVFNVQQVIEEAPAPGITPEFRRSIGEAAVAAARAGAWGCSHAVLPMLVPVLLIVPFLRRHVPMGCILTRFVLTISL